jgi:glucose/mannose-6-phosphate isomerase
VTVEVDEARLDDAAALRAADPGGMLLAVASSGAQVREAVTLAADAGLERLAAEGRPRAFVVAGMGGSAIAGDVLAAVAGTGCPVPVLVHRGYGLPGWVGPADLVAGVSCSGGTEETLSALDEAQRRGCRLLAVGAAGSPLEQRAERARAPFVPAPLGRQPRASVWALSTPLVLAGSVLGLLQAPSTVLEAVAVAQATAARLDEISAICRPDSDAFVNPAKALALELRDTLPLVWGGSPLAAAAAYRFSCQLNENTKYPAVPGVVPEATHNQVVTFDGPFAGRGEDADDLPQDRADELPATPRLRLVLLRDPNEDPRVRRRCEVSRHIATQRGVPVSEVAAVGSSRLERLACLVGLTDYASVYLALLYGIDPTPVAVIEDVKQRIRR